MLSRRNFLDGWRTNSSAALACEKKKKRERELAIQKNKSEQFRYLNTFILHYPPENLSGFYINEKFFNGSSISALTKRSPNRLIVLRSVNTTVLDVTATSGTVVCNYWICLHRKNSGSEAVACKLCNEVNEASAFPNCLYDLPSHSADVSEHKMREMFGRVTQGGRGSDTKHQPSLRAICDEATVEATPLATAQRWSWLLLPGPAASPCIPGLRGQHLPVPGSRRGGCWGEAQLSQCSHHVLHVYGV